jgi:hypothetical protein
VAVRGEPRPTDTCLPVADRDELFALLALTDELFPAAGLDRALRACRRVNGLVHPEGGLEIFEVAAPIIRLLPGLGAFVSSFAPPYLTTFQDRVATWMEHRELMAAAEHSL